MNLYAKITTSTGKVISKADNELIKIEVLDKEQNTIFEKTITTEKYISNNCKNADEGHEFCWDKDCQCSCHNS